MINRAWLPTARRELLPTPEFREFNVAASEIMHPRKSHKFEVLRLLEMRALSESGVTIPEDLTETIEANRPEKADDVVVARVLDPEGLVVVRQNAGTKRYITLQLEPNETLIEERQTILSVIRKETKTLKLPPIFDEYNLEVIMGRVHFGTGIERNEIYEALDEATPTLAVLQKLAIN